MEINDESRGKYDNSSIKFKTSMKRSNLYDHSDAYIFGRGTIKNTGEGDNGDVKIVRHLPSA